MKLRWSKREGRIARGALKKAYNKEMEQIKNELRKKLESMNDQEEIWEIQDYLNKRRKDVEFKYEFDYSNLILAFNILFRQGYVDLKDLEGILEDKIELITKDMKI